MFEREIAALLGATPAQILGLMRSVLNLVEQLVFNHSWQSNTQLAAMAEAQGAEIVRSNGVTANHAASLQQALAAVANAEGRVRGDITAVRNPGAQNALREVLRPLFDHSRQIRDTGTKTLNLLPEIARLNPRRLEGVPLGAGERGRASSVVQQLANQAVSLRARGIEPTLVQNATGPIRAAIAEAEALPAEEREAAVRMTPVIVAMRQLIVAQLRVATATLRAALEHFLGPLETMLQFLARELGGRLNTFFLIPKSLLDQMLRGAGVERNTDA